MDSRGFTAYCFSGTLQNGSVSRLNDRWMQDYLSRGSTPLNFIKFLDHCAKLIILKKVGGGYILIHRMLLDYFADIPRSILP